jgi:hypothetical protein
MNKLTIDQIHEAIQNNKTVYWVNTSYKLVQEVILTNSDGSLNEYQAKHFTRRGDKLLAVRCISNWFGGLLSETELVQCFIQDTEATTKPKCDMTKDCAQDVTHIDSRGFVYCECHGKLRKQGGAKCRKLRPSEIKMLELGQKVERY